MRYHAPAFELGSRLPSQDGPVDKLGGLPFGINGADWPICGDCGKPLSHIGQLVHEETRLDLGGRDRTLTLWQCEQDPGMCETWSWQSSASQALVSPLVPGAGWAAPPTSDTVVYPEARVIAWDERATVFPDGRMQTFHRLG